MLIDTFFNSLTGNGCPRLAEKKKKVPGKKVAKKKPKKKTKKNVRN